jgi:hypothetical protein
VNIAWVRIRSWHALPLGALNFRTVCGRTAKFDSEVVDELPADKSCETCLRIVARKADA